MRPTHTTTERVHALIESGILMLVSTVTLLGVSFVWYAYLSQTNRVGGAFPIASVSIAGLGAWCGYFGIRRLLDAGKVSRYDDDPD